MIKLTNLIKSSKIRNRKNILSPDSLRPNYPNHTNNIHHIGLSGITLAESDQYVAGTSGLGPCLATLGYNQEEGICFTVHHFNPKRATRLIDQESNRAKDIRETDLKFDFYLIGAYKNPKIVSEVESHLKTNYKNQKIIYKDVLNSSGKSVALDVRNGNLYSLTAKQKNHFRNFTEKYA